MKNELKNNKNEIEFYEEKMAIEKMAIEKR